MLSSAWSGIYLFENFDNLYNVSNSSYKSWYRASTDSGLLHGMFSESIIYSILYCRICPRWDEFSLWYQSCFTGALSLSVGAFGSHFQSAL